MANTEDDPFAHMAPNVSVQLYNKHSIWKPPTWVSLNGQPPPALKLLRMTETNVRFARAMLNPNLAQVPQRKADKIRESDLVLRRERTLMIAIISCVDGWEDVFDKARVPMPFPKIGEDPTDPGVKLVRALLRRLGPEAELSFVHHCNDHDRWKIEEDEPDEPALDDKVPLS